MSPSAETKPTASLPNGYWHHFKSIDDGELGCRPQRCGPVSPLSDDDGDIVLFADIGVSPREEVRAAQRLGTLGGTGRRRCCAGRPQVLIMPLTDREREFLAAFIHEATTDPF